MTWVPSTVAAESAEAAVALCSWLETLRVARVEVFTWLFEKWIHHSERKRGRMTLTDDAEIEQAQGLGGTAIVQIEVKPSMRVARSRRQQAAGMAHAHQVCG